MDIETALYRLLINDSEVSRRVSGRVFFGQLPQDVTYPALVYRPAGGSEPVRTLEGGCAKVTETFHVFSADLLKNKSACSLLDRAVMNALDEYTGDVDDGASPASSIFIEGIFGRGHLYEGGLEYQAAEGPCINFLSEFEVHYLDPLKAD